MSNSIERVDAPTVADIDWSKAPEGATHYTIKESGAIWFKNINGFWTIYDSGVWYAIGLPACDLIPRPTSTAIPELKKLTQAVFDGLPPEYRWAAVDADGDIVIADHEHFFWNESKKWFFPSDSTIKIIVKTIGYDATDWQNSLIERQDVPTADKPESIHDVARSIEAARVAEQSERTYPHYFKDVSDVDAIDLYHVARLYDITDPALFHAFKKIACAGKRGAKDQAQDVQEAIDALKRWQELSV